MAKRRSAYDRERNRLMAKIRYWENKGYNVHVEKPLTERQLRKQGLSGSDLRKATQELKGKNKGFEKQYMSSKSSGESYQGRKELKNSMLRETQLALDRFNEFLTTLTTPIVPQYRENSMSYTRHPDVLDTSIRCQKALLSYVRDISGDFTEEEIGAFLLDHPEIFDMLDGMMYASQQEDVYYNYDAIMLQFSDITGTQLTSQEASEILDEVVYTDDYY